MRARRREIGLGGWGFAGIGFEGEFGFVVG